MTAMNLKSCLAYVAAASVLALAGCGSGDSAEVRAEKAMNEKAGAVGHIKPEAVGGQVETRGGGASAGDGGGANFR